jgi:hypothetical protein
MNFREDIEAVKLIPEVVTTFATAWIIVSGIVSGLVKKLPGLKYSMRRAKMKIKFFFHGTLLYGERVRFFKALKAQKETNKAIIEAIAPDMDMEEVLVLDKKALLDFALESNVFYKMTMRKDR